MHYQPTGRVIAFDFETYLISAEAIAPAPVCLSWAQRKDQEQFEFNLHIKPNMKRVLKRLLTCGETLIAHNAAFDLAVSVTHYPELFPLVWEALWESRITDTRLREKLLTLAQIGEVDMGDYSLSGLVKQYFGEDISGSKKDPDAWRTRYSELDGIPLRQWPDEAINYAVGDSVWTVKVYEAQEKRAQATSKRLNHPVLRTEYFQTAVAFALKLCTLRGFVVDQERIAEVKEMLARELAPEKTKQLLESGILRPAMPPQPHKGGHKDHVAGCKRKNCDCPVKMSKPTKESIDVKKLRAFVLSLCGDGLLDRKELDYTATGEISVNKDWLKQNEHLSPVLEEYLHRQKLQKLVTTEIPRLSYPVVHPVYDVLKKTGRTSSKSTDDFPSMNVQNVDPRVRGAICARDGYVLGACDIRSMELCTLAQVCYWLFGFSVHRDLINNGIDLHAYLGAQIAYQLTDTFSNYCEAERAKTRMDYYELFIEMKTDKAKSVRAFFAKYRKMAKPVGLGYPGGLGPRTFISFARGYGLKVSESDAKVLRQIWFDTYPEMPRYFDYINKRMKDPDHNGYFYYTTSMGIYRARSGFCPTANGMALQAPSAEGAKLGLLEVVRESTDPTLDSVLYENCKPIAFVHDEIIAELRTEVAPECMGRIAEIMEAAMKCATPDVESRTEAALMQRWNKSAEPVYDENGRLTIWEPA